jgi:hypothetical protein
MNLSLSQARGLLEDYAACVQAIRDIREACALPDMPLAELPGAVEALLHELADRQIRADIAPALPEPEQAYDDWAPEDTVVPAPVPSCRGCLRLTEIDGRLICGEARSRMYGGGIHWPGPGCVWAGAGDAIYGGGR